MEPRGWLGLSAALAVGGHRGMLEQALCFCSAVLWVCAVAHLGEGREMTPLC